MNVADLLKKDIQRLEGLQEELQEIVNWYKKPLLEQLQDLEKPETKYGNCGCGE